MIIRVVLAAAIAVPSVGCASVTRGATENISISSTPAGATAEVSGLDNPTACVTPCVVVAKRNADITVTVTKEGYEPQVIPLTKEIPGTGAAGFAERPGCDPCRTDSKALALNGRTIEQRHNAVPFATKANRLPLRAYECSIKLAPQSAFTRPPTLRSQAAHAGA